MRPLPLALPYAFVFWAIFLWAFLPEFRLIVRSRRRAAHPASPDAGSFRLIAVGGGAAFWVAVPLAFVNAMQFPPYLRLGLFAGGLGFVVAGSLLRRHCWRMLGEYFTGDVAAQADQPVIERGAYGWVRHPSYTAGTLMTLGLGLALGSWGSTLLLVVATLAVYSYRIAVEERTLLATLGEPYRAYMRQHKRLIPYIF
ncbi:MAG: isoprenylcysteine carboxylmethyltransferase family protein [Gemmatimonadetes bacterium]|nr:isoprenylcysteine carboxylmethyltransferase family protein [Gemmatimonadota bacterium]